MVVNEFIKNIKKLSSTNNIISFKVKEIEPLDIKIGEEVRIILYLSKKGYVCNRCFRVGCYIEPNNVENIEVKCNKCGNLNLFDDLIELSQYSKELTNLNIEN